MTFESIRGETPIDVSGLKVKGVSTRAELSIVEANNIRKAFVKYLAAKPSRQLAKYDVAWSLKLHREMFGDVWNWAGETRQSDLNLGIPWHQISGALKNLFDDLAFWEENWPDVIEQAAHLHHKAVQIHPFQNGNGRWARLLANIWLRQHDAPMTMWPEETIGDTSTIRDEYLDAIKAADRGEYLKLVELHRRFAGTID